MRDITELPLLPSSAAWVAPRRRALAWARQIHVQHRALDVTLCGRVRPGLEITALAPSLEFCPRCLYRASALWGLPPGSRGPAS